LLNGHFELRSGLHSNRFFQCANVLRYPRVAGRLYEELVARLKGKLDLGALDGVISPALGGILVGHEVARTLDTPCVFAEKQEGRLVMRRFTLRPGQRYVVAEDVITRGGRVQETIDIVKAAGAEVVAVWCCRPQRRTGTLRLRLFNCSRWPRSMGTVGVSPSVPQRPFVHPGS
jgi:orotate phosphoribosyltransferase